MNDLLLSYKLYLLDLMTADIDNKIDYGEPQTFEIYNINIQHTQLKMEENSGNINKKIK